MVQPGNKRLENREFYNEMISFGESIYDILASELGPGFYEYRKRWDTISQDKIATDFPIHMGIEVNSGCNYACPMCKRNYLESKKVAHPDFDFDLFCKIIDEGVKKGLQSINLNGYSEPLLKKDIARYAAYARTKPQIYDVILNTNGSLLTADRAEELIDAGLTRLQISIDALTRQTYNAVRVSPEPDTFDRVLENTHGFLKLRKKKGKRLPLLRVSFVKTKTNEHEAEAFIDYWKDKADYISFQKYASPKATNAEIISDHEKQHLPFPEVQCPQPFQRMVLHLDGNAFPCNSGKADNEEAGLIVGHWKEQSISEIWKGPAMEKLRRLHKDGQYRKCVQCTACVLSSRAVDDKFEFSFSGEGKRKK